MNFLSGQDEFWRGQDDFFQTANQPISVRHLSLPYNNVPYYVTTNPSAFQNWQWQSREAKIELPLIECDLAFRIRA